MPPDEAGIGADRLHKAVLGPLDGVLHLRRGRRTLVGGLCLKGDGPHLWEQHHAEAVDQLFRRRLRVRAGVGNTVINAAGKGIFI